MRFIYFLLAALILTACGHQKIRFSKVKRSQKVVEISEIPSLKKKTETAFTPTTELEETQSENASTPAETSESDESIEESSSASQQEVSRYSPIPPEDSTTITVEEANIIKDEAIRAEKLGTWSLISSIAGPVLFLLSTILFGAILPFSPFYVILSGVSAISILVFFTLSYIFGIASLRAQYNTQIGRKRAIAGIVISSAILAIMLFLVFVGF